MAKKDVSINIRITEKMFTELQYVAAMNDCSIGNLVRSYIKCEHDRFRIKDEHFGDMAMVPPEGYR
jgi:hypothetical protein